MSYRSRSLADRLRPSRIVLPCGLLAVFLLEWTGGDLSGGVGALFWAVLFVGFAAGLHTWYVVVTTAFGRAGPAAIYEDVTGTPFDGEE